MKRVLIIDDNQMLADLYRSALEAGTQILVKANAKPKQIVEAVRSTLGK